MPTGHPPDISRNTIMLTYRHYYGTTMKLAGKITVKMMARMKERRREYAECQLAFSKVMLVNEIKQGGKYDV